MDMDMMVLLVACVGLSYIVSSLQQSLYNVLRFKKEEDESTRETYTKEK